MMENIKNKLSKVISHSNYSCVVSIKRKDELNFETVSGYRDIPNKIRNNIDTSFGLASGAKTFTAVAILKLQDLKKLHINDPISKYLKGNFSNYSKDITIKHLLTHTSGIPDYLDEDKNIDLSHVPWSKLLKPIDYFEYFPHKDMDFKPGSKFKYNNGAYIILAHIIDALTGDYHAFVHQLLEEVGIEKTKFYRFDQLPKNTANGYIFKDDTYRTNIYALPIIGGGDGGIFSTVSDIYMFWKKLFSYEIISKESLALFIKPHIYISKDNYYGLGVWIKKNKTTDEIRMIGEDEGVSFISIYHIKKNQVTTIISNNNKDAWQVLKAIE
ncbi:MAG TPA: serine hydrolase domain-containing protein [Candidatus Izemoplasmatales bacterium]|nr:serine hydrolase domain-containing protein [Candidatus Izemoplasmatales bacterium]